MFKLIPAILFVLFSVVMPVFGEEPDHIIDIAISSDDETYTWYKTGNYSHGATNQLDWHTVPISFSLPQGTGERPGKAPEDVAGMAIACSNNQVFTWYLDGKVSSGTTSHLDKYRRPDRYSLPLGKRPEDIVGIGISSDDHVYAWYIDGTVSSGTSTNLAEYRSLYNYTLPTGKNPEDITAISVNCDNEVTAYFKDGLYSSGTTNNLTQMSQARYSLPPGKDYSDIVSMGEANDGHVYAWFIDSMVSAGTISDLDSYRQQYVYTCVPSEPRRERKLVEDIVGIAMYYKN